MQTPAAVRCFVAIPWQAALEPRWAGLQQELGGLKAPLRLSPLGQAHLTLAFYPELPPERMPALQEAAARLAQACPPLQLEARGAGQFPERGRARVLWMGVSDPAGKLAAIARGLPEQATNKWSPHITLARAKRPLRAYEQRDIESWLRRRQEELWAGQRVDHLELVESRLSRGGAVHSVLASFPLAGG